VSLEIFGKDRAEDEWLHTGDLGEIGPDGNLYYKGRKKDVIIGPEGLNVFPADVESVLVKNRAVRDAVVLGKPTERGETVHAVLVLSDRSADPADVVEAANRELEHHQRIRGWTVWPGEDFPRTPSTFKIRRHEVAELLETTERPKEPAPASTRSLLAEQLGRRPEDLRSSQRLSEDLGLSSLDRIELLASLEEKYGVALSESTMAEVETLDDLERFIANDSRPVERKSRSSPLSGIVRVARTPPVRLVRAAFRETVILPLFRHYIPLEVEGALEGIEPPVIFAPNHTSNLDTLAILAALPRAWRNGLAPAVSQDYFLPYLEGTGTVGERVTLGFQFFLAVTALNVFPLPQATRGVRDALHFAGKLVDSGYSILIFPEGRRSTDGTMQPFRPGVGLMAVRLRIPVVPVHIGGLFEVLPVHRSWPRPGPARVRFGSPLSFAENEDYEKATDAIEQSVRRLA
jgi:long-chain acyl-CoA synthetase